jgi:galactokinase
MTNQQPLVQRFHQRYKSVPRVFRAPGRVNLIGEHTDYNDGFVFPAAIDFYTYVAASKRTDGGLSIFSANYNEGIEIDLHDPALRPRKHWSDYVCGVALMLSTAGYQISGANLLIESNVPLGAGLSSSAALEVAVATALLGISRLAMDRLQLAKLCQRAENEFVGARCGIMDQFICSHAKPDTALLLDCRSLEYQALPIAPDFTLVACNTMVKHDLATGAYNQRRAECEEGVRRLKEFLPGIRALRDVSLEDFNRYGKQLPEMVFRRCRHVIAENERVNKAASCLQKNDTVGFGKLMAESHRSLRDDYEVSCAELDLMVEIANRAEGVAGSRMTGGGFGGCTINLVRSGNVPQFRDMIQAEYEKETGKRPEIYVSRPAAGAEEINVSGVTLKA